MSVVTSLPLSAAMPIASDSAVAAVLTVTFGLVFSPVFWPKPTPREPASDVATALTPPELSTVSLSPPTSMPIALDLAVEVTSASAAPSIVIPAPAAALVDVAIAVTAPVLATSSTPLCAVEV